MVDIGMTQNEIIQVRLGLEDRAEKLQKTLDLLRRQKKLTLRDHENLRGLQEQLRNIKSAYDKVRT